MAFKCYSGFLVISSLLIISEGQLHQLKYMNSDKPAPSAPPQFSSAMPLSEMRNVKNKFSKADRICVAGMWALYNTTDFGEGADDSTTVISIRGTDVHTCTSQGQMPILKSVQSVVYLGSSNYGNDGVLIFSQAYLLGGLWNVTVATDGTASDLPENISGFPLGSLAITGSRAWLICADRDVPCSNGVCVNMKDYANLFLQRNVARDNSMTNGWPKTVRKVRSITTDECRNYPNPALLKSRLFKRDAIEKIDISVDKLSV